jgi:hypothetical protein
MSFSMRPRDDVPFQQQATYITLHRMLIRYQHNILLQPPSDTLTAFQEGIQRDLRSPLPYQRTRWLHNIEYARTLLLQLEHGAQGIKVQRVKKDVIRDLAEKRMLIKRLRSRVEELGTEGNVLSDEQWAADGNSETLEEILERPALQEDADLSKHAHAQEQLNEKPVPSIAEENSSFTQRTPSNKPPPTRSDKDLLFGTRRRLQSQKSPSTSSPSSTNTLATAELPRRPRSRQWPARPRARRPRQECSRHGSCGAEDEVLAEDVRGPGLVWEDETVCDDYGVVGRGDFARLCGAEIEILKSAYLIRRILI